MLDLKKIRLEHWILGAILFAIFLLRFPSLFEPFWYGDEGIFAAVGRNLNFGGVLYADAWDNKPPMIYLTYQAIFKVFGVSMFWLRMVTLVFVLATAAVIYEISMKIWGAKRALLAASIFGFLTSLRVLEGNLALTEIFMILPISLAMMISLFRKFDNVSLFFAGILFAIASLYKQVGALEAAALGIFLFFYSKNPFEFIKSGLALSLGFTLPYLATIAYFAPKNLVGEYVFAAYTYYRIYFDESPQYVLLINILKYLPIAAIIAYSFFQKRKKHLSVFHLVLLWLAFSFLGSYFSGRTYGHYLIQVTPALSLVLASFSFRPKLQTVQVAFAIVYFTCFIFLTKLLFSDFISGGPINQVSYWQNFLDFSTGRKNVDQYNHFFDRNVNSVMALADFLKANDGHSENVYIWGDYPWLYAISDLKNPVRYVTSFHVFGVPSGEEEVAEKLNSNKPKYIIKPESSTGYFEELENLLTANYTFVAKVENSEVYQLVN